jgi:hypothetical protein
MPSKKVLCHGVEDMAERIQLRVGALSMVFEPQLGFLRYMTYGGKEILRGVYAAVRDRNWGTIEPRVSMVELQEEDEGFVLSFDVECISGDVDFFWRGRIVGEPGRVEFSLDGIARKSFSRNRLGFSVLHPAECAGLACRVGKVDGTVEEGVFPLLISPHQPFMDMKSIAHEVDGVRSEITFAGDIFEMEDQRNWTDASYKTYCTPLALPFPVDVAEGEVIQQTIVIEVEGTTDIVDEDRGCVLLAVESIGGENLMHIGLGLASDAGELSEVELARLRALNLSHLRVDLHLAEQGWQTVLARAWREAEALAIGLEVAIFVSDAAARQLAELAGALDGADICRILVFHEDEKSTTAGWVNLAREYLSGLQVPIGAGSNDYFTELNRERPPVEVLDLVSYSLNPQVHAFDDVSLAETLMMQMVVAHSARQFCGDLPLCVSPVTLLPRFNPNVTGAEPEPGPGDLPPQVDVRQMSLFGAGWTALSLKYLALRGVASSTYYETSGWRGVMERAEGSALPEVFQSIAGAVFPLYHVLADVGEYAGGKVFPVHTSDLLRVDGVALVKGERRRLLLVNLTGETVAVQISGWTGAAYVVQLDERNVERAMSEPEVFRAEQGVRYVRVESLDLLPYAVTRVDLEVDS